MKIRNERPHALVLLSLLLALFVAGCTVPVQHGLSERQANEIIVLFAKNGINATKMADTSGREIKWTIMVDSSNNAKAIRLLQRHNMPFEQEKGFQGVYGTTGMIPTATEEKAKYLMALSGELQNTLRKVDGVLDARVHLVIPKERILKNPNDPKPQPRASVMMIVRMSPAPAITSKDVKELLRGSLEDLSANNINVVFVRQRPDGAGDDASATGGADMAAFLGVRVASSDTTKLKIIVGLLCACILLFLGLFVWSFFRSASLKNQLRAMGGQGGLAS
ncbi:MAG: hypothetical protein H6728_07540 [Myxococcales bacterium]|nr:hypothetical protein [Myxococcales bacterium]MCB9642914.1 hypothetical protein [Myxococcales bacterium]